MKLGEDIAAGQTSQASVTMELFNIVRVRSIAPQNSAIDGMCGVALRVKKKAEESLPRL